MLDPVFNVADLFMRVAAPKTTSFIRSLLMEEQAPKSFAERNLRQLVLAKRIAAQCELELVAAVEALAPLYESRFPKQPKPRRVIRRIGNASIDVTDFPH